MIAWFEIMSAGSFQSNIVGQISLGFADFWEETILPLGSLPTKKRSYLGKSHKFGWLGGKNKNRLPYQNMSVLKEGMKKSPLSYSLRVVFPGCGQSRGSVAFWHTSQITLHPPPPAAVNSFVPFRFNFVTLILFCPLCHPNAPSPLPLPVSSFAKPAHNSSPPPPAQKFRLNLENCHIWKQTTGVKWQVFWLEICLELEMQNI